MERVELGPAFLTRYKRAYNRLPDIDDAYASLRRRSGYLDVIRAALRIIKDQGANDFLGVLLVHRHFRCDTGSLFVERRYTPNARGRRTVLLTTALAPRKWPRRMAPYRFKIDRTGRLQPLEFTTDLTAIAHHRRLVESRELCRDLGRYFSHHGYASSLGVGIFSRGGPFAAAPRIFMEETDFEAGESVTHVLRSLSVSIGRPIPTLWTIGLYGNACCLPRGACTAYCSKHGQEGASCGHTKGKASHLGCV